MARHDVIKAGPDGIFDIPSAPSRWGSGTLAPIAPARFNSAQGAFIMALRRPFRRLILLAAAFASIAAFAASPAWADRCDDTANQLKAGVDGLSIGRTAAGVIFLSHPQAKALSLGCASKNFSSQLYARSANRKPKPAFLGLVASAAAIIFTLPKADMQKGAGRCLRALGLFRSKAAIRYRRLDMRCVRTKTDASITISRDLDE